jgi:hypothetical protein
MAIAAATLLRMSMQDLGVLGGGEAAEGVHLADGLQRLQMMIASWSLDALTVVRTDRLEFPVVPTKQSYSIGPGLEFDTARPVGQQSVVGAGLLLMSSTPPVEIPRALLTYDMWQAVAVKRLTSTLFTTVFYRPGSLARTPPTAPVPPTGIDTGEIILWPIPTQANPLVLYIERVIPPFENLTTPYPIPDGIVAAIQYNLTLAIAPMFQVTPSDEAKRQARDTFAAMKRTNYQMADAAIDPMFTMQGGVGGYDINTGTIRTVR